MCIRDRYLALQTMVSNFTNPIFPIHDGVITDGLENISEAVKLIAQKTGITFEIDNQKLEVI